MMAVHFDFTVSDEEAQTIMDCIRDEIHRAKLLALEITTSDPNYRQWYEGRAKFMESLIAKMHNSRADDEGTI